MKTLSIESGETSDEATRVNWMIYGVSMIELILRFIAAGGTLGSAMVMGTTQQAVPLFSQSLLLNAKFSDLPMFTFFVIANSVACAYLVLSLPLSLYHTIKRAAKKSRVILVMFDTAMLGLVVAGASAAASIVYLAHEGNGKANWMSICQQLDSFCERTSGSLISSFASAFVLMLIIISSTIIISHC